MFNAGMRYHVNLFFVVIAVAASMIQLADLHGTRTFCNREGLQVNRNCQIEGASTASFAGISDTVFMAHSSKNEN